MRTSDLALLLLLLLCFVTEERVLSRIVTPDQLMVESRDNDVNDKPVCTPGNCTKCWVYETIQVCLIASITTVDVIHIALVAPVASGDWIIVQGDVTAASHVPLCVTDVPGADFEKVCLIPYNVDMGSFAFCLNITLTQHNITFLYDNTCYKIPPKPTHIEGDKKNDDALEFDAENVDATEEENYKEYDVETEDDDVNKVDDATSIADVISDD